VLGCVVLGTLAAVSACSAGDPEQKDAQPVLKVPGSVEPFAEARLFARITGYVQKAQADIGDRVRKGRVLAELAVPEREAELARKKALVIQTEVEVQQAQGSLKEVSASVELTSAQVQEAEASVKRDQATLKFRTAQHSRIKTLVASGSVEQGLLDTETDRLNAAKAALNEAEFKLQTAKVARQKAAARRDTAEAGVRLAKARLDVARADLQRVTALLQYARIVAPFDGVVTRRSVSVGDLAAPPRGRAMPLFTVARLDTVRVVVNVPDKDAPRVRVGSEASIKLDALPGQVLKGKVTRTAAALDPAKRTLRAEIDLPNPDGKLLPGMYGTVTLKLGRD
jgi:multidrug resistance efflux pump